MKFTRRHDLDPQTRIGIVQDVWSHQGIYGKMTQIARPRPGNTILKSSGPIAFRVLATVRDKTYIGYSW
jgi:hypothetical protein